MDLHYNAFISYRHHPQDIKVAETIHRALERFKVPKALKQQGKSIERIFRDKEELPITSSLTDNISMALRNSDYQIVICSTHLKDSYWVQREIDTFLQTHTKDKVLTVLVDGDNPYDVIPEILTYNEVVDPVTGEVTREPIEPLSCDWRLPKRKAMREELPRLAAVLLGCTYDDLIQRQKQYRQRRLLAGISTGMVASLALAGYFLYTSIQIQENLNQSLRNQSQYLASASQERFSEGDRLTALALAMEALPSEENTRPYVAAAEDALTDALMLYEADGELISVAAFPTEGVVAGFVVSDDGETLYTLDNQYTVSAWDTMKYKKLSTFNILGYPLGSAVLLTDSRSNLLTIGGADDDTLMCYTREGDKLWEMESIEDIAFTADKNTLLAIREITSNDWSTPNVYELLQINPENGELTAAPFVLFDHDLGYGPSFVTDTFYEGQPIALHCYASLSQAHVLVADPVKQDSRVVLSYDSYFAGGSVTEDGKLYVMVTENTDISNARMANYYFYTQEYTWLHCIDMNSGKQKWCTKISSYNYSECNTIIPISDTGLLFCQRGSAFLQVDAKTGKIVKECHSTTIPLAVQMRDDYVWVLFSNGCAGSYTFDSNKIGYIQYMENGLLMGHNNQGIYVVPQLESNILLYRNISDETYEAFGGEYADYISQFQTQGDLMATAGSDYLHMFDLSTKQMLWKQECSYSDYLLGFSSDGSTLFLKSNSNIRQIRTDTGEMTEWELPMNIDNTQFYMYYDSIGYGSETVCCMLRSYETPMPRILFYDCNTHEAVTSEFSVEEDSTEWNSYGNYPVVLHVTDTYALIRTVSGNVYRFDRATSEITVAASNVSNNAVLLEDAENNRLALSAEDGILLMDTVEQTTLHIPVTDYFAVSFYFYEDILLCLGSDGSVHRFDLKGNELGVTNLSLFSNFFSEANNISFQDIPISWSVTPDNEIVVNVFRMGNIINTENWERTCDIRQLVCYHAGSDSFIAQSNGMIYGYKRCSLDEIMTRAQDALGTFELTDEQKEFYGLN